MACPQCGTSDRRETLAPGLFRCVNVTLEPGWGPHGTELYPVPCHRTYQEATPGMDVSFACRCRTLAIRSCAVCEQPICHDHSRRHGDTWRCQWCVAQQQEAERRAQAERERAERARYAALPPLTPELLGRYLRGDAEVVVGETHQTLALTNRAVLDVLLAAGLDARGAWGGGREVFWIGGVGFDSAGAVYEPESYDGPYEVTHTRPKRIADAQEIWAGSLPALRAALPGARTMSTGDRRHRDRRAAARTTWRTFQALALVLAVAFLITAFSTGSALYYLPMLALVGTAMAVQARIERL